MVKIKIRDGSTLLKTENVNEGIAILMEIKKRQEEKVDDRQVEPMMWKQTFSVEPTAKKQTRVKHKRSLWTAGETRHIYENRNKPLSEMLKSELLRERHSALSIKNRYNIITRGRLHMLPKETQKYLRMLEKPMSPFAKKIQKVKSGKKGITTSPWTEEEDTLVRDNAGKKLSDLVPLLTNRSRSAVANRRMKLKRTKAILTPENFPELE